jgi:hypothetical protein
MLLPLASLALISAAPASATVVSSFAPYSATPTAGQWFQSDVRTGGSASVADLTGLGGNLENNQPSPTGAAKLTTNDTNSAKAEVGVTGNYGTAGDILSSMDISYSYYRHNDPGTNQAAAPSLKLTFYNASYSSSGNDGYVTLVYEPYWNQPGSAGSAVNPPSDQWQSVNISYTNGLFWQNGGFGQTNSAGGPPLKTLSDWASTFNSAFSAADLLYIGMGVGTYNPGQTDYFDNVDINYTNSASGDAYSASYNFNPASVPEPTTLSLMLMGVVGLGCRGRRRARKG